MAAFICIKTLLLNKRSATLLLSAPCIARSRVVVQDYDGDPSLHWDGGIGRKEISLNGKAVKNKVRFL